VAGVLTLGAVEAPECLSTIPSLHVTILGIEFGEQWESGRHVVELGVMKEGTIG
jgi:hypothetical protein